jgi:hypothetical protein
VSAHKYWLVALLTPSAEDVERHAGQMAVASIQIVSAWINTCSGLELIWRDFHTASLS